MNNEHIQTAIAFTEVKKNYLENDEVYSVLNGVSGKVKQGSFVMIVGPSGSGKSTLLSMCNLLHTPDEGEIYVFGKEIRKWDVTELRKKVGIAFQSAPILDGTVRDNMLIVQKLHNKQHLSPEQLCSLTGLPHNLLDRDAKDLSGGQKQRLSLARTLSNPSDILLLDEITSALDIAAAHEIEELIVQLNKEQNKTIIWVTHNLDQAKRLADEVWLMIDGKLIESADPTLFFTNPKHPETQAFLQGASL
ncbi:ABC transporter ATP-binding protein [Niallia sp. 01092]|uniref:ABC transporter ATP-binding protein n=1 Tax=unclassified Niallia TaxID=2837522 RepID=UPI003FD41C2E